jgi:hypothetical protein
LSRRDPAAGRGGDVSAGDGSGPAADRRNGAGRHRPGALGRRQPCPFDITFTGTGTVTRTTYYDNNATPIRQGIHGALTHTVFSAWHTLVSNGPAPVHIDLVGGQMIDTGMEFAFHLRGDGIVLAQAGRLTLAADDSQLDFVGMSCAEHRRPLRGARAVTGTPRRPVTRRSTSSRSATPTRRSPSR